MGECGVTLGAFVGFAGVVDGTDVPLQHDRRTERLPTFIAREWLGLVVDAILVCFENGSPLCSERTFWTEMQRGVTVFSLDFPVYRFYMRP